MKSKTSSFPFCLVMFKKLVLLNQLSRQLVKQLLQEWSIMKLWVTLLPEFTNF
ncbi:hypothetical protein B6A09_1220 [Saccharomyces cerevisiae synthetic construct]|uniref:Uncharacterized protein YBR121C-A n=2 Tax=Saccharomyces cerevisiae TaxID=4932 RepID=YB121_YEAST|nr:RecName: Full=Uncharacterized protein YBR121C-A [Saccharomyces cerevisiae S288C]ARB01919.1 hypothetical protein B6A09_1220 [Saccharomyces cerevisiae synthetic construct]WNV72015.1 hypothetical protein O6U65_0259 [Saccharomyces cerevisiae synthetic construct]CBK39194.1 EC1118_1B15_2718p [Saccharomyces cerevisiae EC1118]